MPAKKDSRLTKAGVSGFNKPKRTPNHPTKSHIVVWLGVRFGLLKPETPALVNRESFLANAS